MQPALKGRNDVPQSHAQILVHLVFSTKNREPVLTDEIRNELHAYIGGIMRNEHGTLLCAGSVADHIHLLVALPRTRSPAQVVLEIKTGSSKWIKNQGRCFARFHLAEWIWRLFRQPVTPIGFGIIYPQSGGAPS